MPITERPSSPNMSGRPHPTSSSSRGNRRGGTGRTSANVPGQPLSPPSPPPEGVGSPNSAGLLHRLLLSRLHDIEMQLFGDFNIESLEELSTLYTVDALRFVRDWTPELQNQLEFLRAALNSISEDLQTLDRALKTIKMDLEWLASTSFKVSVQTHTQLTKYQVAFKDLRTRFKPLWKSTSQKFDAACLGSVANAPWLPQSLLTPGKVLYFVGEAADQKRVFWQVMPLWHQLKTLRYPSKAFEERFNVMLDLAIRVLPEARSLKPEQLHSEFLGVVAAVRKEFEASSAGGANTGS